MNDFWMGILVYFFFGMALILGFRRIRKAKSYRDYTKVKAQILSYREETRYTFQGKPYILGVLTVSYFDIQKECEIVEYVPVGEISTGTSQYQRFLYQKKKDCYLAVSYNLEETSQFIPVNEIFSDNSFNKELYCKQLKQKNFMPRITLWEEKRKFPFQTIIYIFLVMLPSAFFLIVITCSLIAQLIESLS